MNKLDFVKKICEKSGQSQSEVEKTLKAVSEVIVEQVRDNGEEVQLNGVGIFKQKVSEAHKGRNPFNGEEIQVKASKSIKFKVSSAVRK